MFPKSLKYILQIVIYSKDQLVKIFLSDRVSWYEKECLNAMQEINAAHMLEGYRLYRMLLMAGRNQTYACPMKRRIHRSPYVTTGRDIPLL